MDLKEKLRDQNMKFRQNLFEMFMNGRYTDVTLVCDEGTEVWAHKFVLASASSVLKGMFKEDANKPAERQVIRIAGSSYPDLIALIQWVYLGFFKVAEVTGNMVDISEGLKIDLGMKLQRQMLIVTLMTPIMKKMEMMIDKKNLFCQMSNLILFKS